MSIINRNGKLVSDTLIDDDHPHPLFRCPKCGIEYNLNEIDSLWNGPANDKGYVYKCNECGETLVDVFSNSK
jgi:predicted RNA-binding Zn-ribbon protein involved in translation (DUF1610 family)